MGAFLDNLRYLTGTVSTKVQPLPPLQPLQALGPPIAIDTEPQQQQMRTFEVTAPPVFVERPVDYAINFDKPIDYNKELKALQAQALTTAEPQQNTLSVESEDAWLRKYKGHHINPFMADLYQDLTFVIKKKANYKERLTCGLWAQDNVFKVYEWREDSVTKGRRVLRLEQFSPGPVRLCCGSQLRPYTTFGEASNRARLLTKSIRSFRWPCPLNRNKPATSVFDSQSGFLGRIEYRSSLEGLLPC